MRTGGRGWARPSLLAGLVAGPLAGCLGGADEHALGSARGSTANAMFSGAVVFPRDYGRHGEFPRPPPVLTSMGDYGAHAPQPSGRGIPAVRAPRDVQAGHTLRVVLSRFRPGPTGLAPAPAAATVVPCGPSPIRYGGSATNVPECPTILEAAP